MHSYFYHLKFELYPTSDPTAAPTDISNIWIPTAKSTVFDDLPSHPRKDDESDEYREQKSRNRSKSATVTPQDWRFGRISIDTIDPRMAMAVSDAATSASAAPSLGPSFSGPGTETKATCVRLGTNHTEAGWGVVHFYRDEQESQPRLPDLNGAQQHSTAAEEDCETVCIPAVPGWMEPGDLWGFVGDRWREDIIHCRMVMTNKMNRYLVLLKFRHGKIAREWKKMFDGKVFNTMEVRLSCSGYASCQRRNLLTRLFTVTSLSRRVCQEHHV